MQEIRLPLSILIIILCFTFRNKLESDPVTHVLVQLPLLVCAGMLLIEKQPFFLEDWNRNGFPTILIAIVMIAFWMLPRSIDAALASPLMEVWKFISVPLLIGIPLKLGWQTAHPLLTGFLKAQTVSMLGILAFLYTHAPVRICNAYGVYDQERLGYGFLFVAIGAAFMWSIPLFSPQHFNSEFSENSMRSQ